MRLKILASSPPTQEKRNDDDPTNNNQNQDNPDDFTNDEYDERIKYQKNNQALIDGIKNVPPQQEFDDKNNLDEVLSSSTDDTGLRYRKVSSSNSENENNILLDEQTRFESLNTTTKPSAAKSIFSTRIHGTWIFLFCLIGFVLASLVYRLDVLHVDEKKFHVKMKPFLEEFTNSTATLMNEMDEVDLPPSSKVMDGTVFCRRFANIVEHSPAFKDTGHDIAILLREFSLKIMDAGTSLEDMYRMGDMLFWTLDKSISEIILKLNPSLFDKIFEKDDQSFFKTRIQDMIDDVHKFQKKVTLARKAITDAENFRDKAENKVRAGKKEAEKFVNKHPGINEYRFKLVAENLERVDEDISIDVENAKFELENADRMLMLLEKSAEGLDRIIKILKNYTSKLMDVDAQLDGMSRVSKRDLGRLEKLVENLRESHINFKRKDETIG
ncbi:5138_t:CDS:2 [Entrophospora sp. SA101]|nr:3714_t:CDS:2 [Entrophospora sp. SA101]CAJ0750648.1 5138_t:CDS:2 [Entrophospora sp. SA101]CAJ0846326.1 16620_t:CDS:2 [Entrophospora sp. SA101]